MDKRTLRYLEMLFGAEIEGRTMQLHPKTAARLEGKGLIRSVQREGRDRLGAYRWTVHELTHAGRFLYCSTCTDPDLTQS